MSRTPLRQNVECSYQDLRIMHHALEQMLLNATDMTPRELHAVNQLANKLIDATNRMIGDDNSVPWDEDPAQIAMFPKSE